MKRVYRYSANHLLCEARPSRAYYSQVAVAAVAMLATLWTSPAMAGNFIGLAQPGAPGTVGVLLFPSFSHNEPNVNTGKMFTELTYFSETGFTGTKRDQFQTWLGFYTGTQTTPAGSKDAAMGVSTPQLGFEYYYQLVQSNDDAPFGSDAFRSWWVSPMLSVSAPNGSSKSNGFGAGANQWSVSTSVNNYIGYGRWHASIAPVSAVYLFRNRNATDMGDGKIGRARAGLTLSLMDLAVGYQVKDDLLVGVHHAYNIYNARNSDFKRASEGMLGPTFTYLGFAQNDLIIAGTLDFDYHNKGVPRGVSLNLMLVKFFK